MNDTDTMALTRRFAETLQALERSEDALDDMVELFAERATIANSALDLEDKRHEGRDGARAFWTTYREQLADIETEFHDTTAGEGSGGLFWTTKGKGADGEPIEYRGATLLAFDADGSIERFRGYYDTRQLVLSGG